MLANFYDYSKMIGEGSFGKVYIGEHRITKKQVAIKQNTDMPTFLLHESKILRALQIHKNIPKMVWYGNLHNKPTLIMELLTTSLQDIREKGFIKNTKQMGLILNQIIDGIKFIHSKNIIHRDIKPENIMFKMNKQDICIIDFGLAKYYKINGEHVPFANNMDVIGSFNYCSANINKGYRPSRRDDIESILYVMLNMTTNLFPCNKSFNGLTKQEKNDFLYNFKTSIQYDGDNIFIKKVIRHIKHVQGLNYHDEPHYTLIKSVLK